MKRLSLLMFVALSGSVLIQSCKSGDKNSIQVPVDAAFVLHVNNSSLSTKLTWDEIRATNWFKEASAEADAKDTLLRSLLQNPDNSGIDTKADMVVYMKKQGRGSYFAFQGTLKDAAAFEAFNKQAFKTDAAVKEGEGSFIKMKDGGYAYTEGTKFIYLFDAPFDFSGAMGRGNYEPYKFPDDSLKIFAKGNLHLSGKNSLSSDDRFADLMKTNGDLHFWIDNEKYIGSLGGDMLGAFKFADLMKGNATGTTINFDNGKITMDSKSYVNDQLASLFKKYPPKKISSAVINRIPSQNVVAVLAMNYPPEGLKEFVKLTGLDGFADTFLSEINYSVAEFIKANKGDLLVAVSDLQIENKETVIPGADGEEPFRYSGPKTDVKVLFATSINDKAAFDKLINNLSAKLPADKMQMPEIKYQVDKDWFAASNAPDYASKFLAGGNSNLPFASKLDGQAFGMYVDLQKAIKSTQATATDSTQKLVIDASLQMWQDILVVGGDFKNGAWTTHGEVVLVDKNTNSLKQLNQYLDKMSAMYKRPRYADADGPLVDTVTTVAPPTPGQ